MTAAPAGGGLAEVLGEVFAVHDEMEELRRALTGPINTRMEVARQLQRASNRFDALRDELRSHGEAIAELIEAIETDAVNRAIAAGLGASEWRAFIPHRIAAALAKVASNGDTK